MYICTPSDFQMAAIPGLMICGDCIGISPPKHPFRIGRYFGRRLNHANKVQLTSGRISKARHEHLNQKGSTSRYAVYEGRNHNGLNFDGDNAGSPFWLPSPSDVVSALKSLLVFLAEQPSQLKYIEWPSFQSTLKTATLTLVLVALLIVALSSVDAALSFLLALFLRRTV